MKSEEVIRYFREMCGDFFPTETKEAKRFVLTVPDPNNTYGTDASTNMKVPVFVRRTEKATYPQIRIAQFLGNPEKFTSSAWTYSYGVPPNEIPTLKYRRARVDTIVHRAQIQVDAFSNDKIEVYRIRDELIARIHKFIYVEVAPFVENDWAQDINNVYYNTGYNTSFNIIKCYENDVLLSKTSDVENTQGSWNLTDEGLFVNPLEDINAITFYEITNGGNVFSDSTTARSKGFLNVKVIRSRPMDDINPLISRWIITFGVDYREDIVMDVGRTFGEVLVNDEKN
jgi:hypothetical protein